MGEDFFEEPFKQSKVKSQIVAKYFDVWANIIAGYGEQIAYVDLFAGQGYYEDGTESTPLLILKKAFENPKIAQKLIIEFNDQNVQYVESLRRAVNQLDGIANLPKPPKFSSVKISRDIAKQYGETSHPRTLFFLDPWGYKGLSLDLIRVAVKDWASECLLFFNYKRINMDLHKSSVDQNINEILGKQRADKLRAETTAMSPYKREEKILGDLCQALDEMGGKYTLPFCFRDRKRDRTSHYLIHATKHHLGYGLMKEIMNEYSIHDKDGVPTFIFDPKQQMTLNFGQPLRDLIEQLVEKFKEQELKVRDIYEKHQKETRFVKKNYKDALRALEGEGKIEIDLPFEERRVIKGKVSLGDDRIVKFH
ncbi:three-Cys-motif partner protein TcmP [bacterium]|nr:three-Cys-motif partner protein TcmP [bacterium]